MTKSQTKPEKKSGQDDFRSVAKRLECDPSEERFDRALREIAKQPPKPAGGH